MTVLPLSPLSSDLKRITTMLLTADRRQQPAGLPHSVANGSLPIDIGAPIVFFVPRDRGH